MFGQLSHPFLLAALDLTLAIGLRQTEGLSPPGFRRLL